MENHKKHLIFVLCYFVFAIVVAIIIAKFMKF